MAEFVFRVHWNETDAFGTRVASNVISTESTDVESARISISGAIKDLVSITHIGTIDDPGK